MAKNHKTPGWLLALGSEPVPGTIELGGRIHRLALIFKHDFFAYTALYQSEPGPPGASAVERVVLKVGRKASFCGLPLSWIGRWNAYHESAVFREVDDLEIVPRFTALPEPGDHLTAGIIMAPTLDYMDRAYLDARQYGWSREPIVEMLIPSTLDDSLAPAGRHVASLFCQHVAPELPDGRSWDDHRDEVADVMIATVDRFAPGFRASVLGRQIKSPLDLERDFGLIGGDIFHGKMGLDQLFSNRPMLGHADYRMPLMGLYLCGAGAHPGGGVTGAPGHNAARAVIADRRKLKL